MASSSSSEESRVVIMREEKELANINLSSSETTCNLIQLYQLQQQPCQQSSKSVRNLPRRHDATTSSTRNQNNNNNQHHPNHFYPQAQTHTFTNRRLVSAKILVIVNAMTLFINLHPHKTDVLASPTHQTSVRQYPTTGQHQLTSRQSEHSSVVSEKLTTSNNNKLMAYTSSSSPVAATNQRLQLKSNYEDNNHHQQQQLSEQQQPTHEHQQATSVSSSNNNNNPETGALKYLQKYGYMQTLNTEANNNLISEESFSSAIASFQRFANLPETGMVDNETLRFMQMPRCGNPDQGHHQQKTPLNTKQQQTNRAPVPSGPLISIVRTSLGAEEPSSTSMGLVNRGRKKRYALQGSKWRRQELTYRISQYPTRFSGKRHEVDSQIEKAFGIWSQVAPIDFVVKKEGRVHIDIRFASGDHGDGDAFDGPGNTLAHAYFPQYGGDAHFDDQEYWTVDSYAGTNIFQVAAHELGHSLGLGHSNVREALMAPFYQKYKPNFKLHIDDVLAIQALYGEKPFLPSSATGAGGSSSVSDLFGSSSSYPHTHPHHPPPPPPPTTTTPPPPTTTSARFFPTTTTTRTSSPPPPPPTTITTTPTITTAAGGTGQGTKPFSTKYPTNGRGKPTFIGGGGFKPESRETNSEDGEDQNQVGSNRPDFGGHAPGGPAESETGVAGASGYPADLCFDSTIDAVTRTEDGNSYVFKGDYYWLLTNDGLAKGYPRKISLDWDDLPGSLDAALTWADGKTFFFKGNKYWRYRNRARDIGYPKLISSGFAGIPDDIDAAFVWSGNGRTYIFKGTEYWRFDSKADPPVSSEYPRPIKVWNGVPSHINAAFKWENNVTYFFKGNQYYRFNDKEFKVESRGRPPFPRQSSEWWFGCVNSNLAHQRVAPSTTSGSLREQNMSEGNHEVRPHQIEGAAPSSNSEWSFYSGHSDGNVVNHQLGTHINDHKPDSFPSTLDSINNDNSNNIEVIGRTPGQEPVRPQAPPTTFISSSSSQAEASFRQSRIGLSHPVSKTNSITTSASSSAISLAQPFRLIYNVPQQYSSTMPVLVVLSSLLSAVLIGNMGKRHPCPIKIS